MAWTVPAAYGVVIVPDNGSGTADMPLAMIYDSPNDDMHIIDGLPAGTKIDIDAALGSFFDVFTEGILEVEHTGGNLGGTMKIYGGVLNTPMVGTGELAGYDRNVAVNMQMETHYGPRMPGDPVQSFDTDMFRMSGQLPPGDPDFDLLRITAGTGFGMPSPGHTTLTRLGGPGSNWAVDSFFDITYRIDFVGAPGGPLAGRSGSTTGTIRTGTPEPGTLVLLVTGLVGLLAYAWRRRR